MKKTMSVRELKDYCDRNKPRKVLFSSENQPWYKVSDPCKMQFSFSIMLIYENPNLVCLKSDTNTLSFDRVRFVEMNTELTVLGTALTLFCGECSCERSYTLIVA